MITRLRRVMLAYVALALLVSVFSVKGAVIALGAALAALTVAAVAAYVARG